MNTFLNTTAICTCHCQMMTMDHHVADMITMLDMTATELVMVIHLLVIKA